MDDEAVKLKRNREKINGDILAHLYAAVNKYWPDINVGMVDDIINRFNDIIDTIHEKYNVPDHLVKQNERAYITKRIVSNDKIPTATGISTVLSLVTAMLKFNIFYNENKKKLFSNACVHDVLICHVSNFNLNAKITNPYTNKKEPARNYWLLNDYNITEQFERFLNVDISELGPYM